MASAEETYLITLYENLGRGYGVLHGAYANAEETSAKPLFDVGADQLHEQAIGVGAERQVYFVPRDIEIVNDTTTAGYSQCGTTLTEYESNFHADIGVEGNAGAFKGSTKDRYDEEKGSTVYHQYATWVDPVKLYGLRLTANAATLQNQLLDPFKSALANLKPLMTDAVKFEDAAFALFDEWGTHYVNSIIIGGRLEYIATVDQNTYSSKSELSVAVKASYKAVKASTTVSTDSSVKRFNAASVTNVHGFGGDPTKLDENNLPGTFGVWLDSIKQRPAFTEFAPKGLVGIWELCDPVLNPALEAAYDAYCERSLQLRFGDSVLFRCESGGAQRWLTGCRGHGAEHVLVKTGESGDKRASYCWTLCIDPHNPGKGPISYGDTFYFRNDSSNTKFMSGNRGGENKSLVMQDYEGDLSSFRWSFRRSTSDTSNGGAVLSGSILSIRSEQNVSADKFLSGVRGEPTEQVLSTTPNDGHALSFQWMATADISAV